jgi:hypothetical protein
MRTRDKQKIYRRFMAGESAALIAHSKGAGVGTHHPLVWQVENILREGHAKGWNCRKRVAK